MLEQPDAYSLVSFASRHNISRSKVYGEIRAGQLIARKVGDRTIILAEDGRAWRENLPKVVAIPDAPTTRTCGAAPKCIEHDDRSTNPMGPEALGLRDSTSRTEEIATDGLGRER